MEPKRMAEPFPMQLPGCEKSGTESRLECQDIKGRSLALAFSAMKRPLPVNAAALRSAP